jgi:hypothetical protein
MARALNCRDASGERSASFGVDSRQYAFAFPIDSLSAIPADFGDVPPLGSIRAGAFLPRGEPDRTGIRPYHANVLLVTGSEVLILPHPSAGESTVRVPIRAIEGFEWGQMLLMGWVRLFWSGGSTQFRYNRRSSRPIEEAIQAIEIARHSPEFGEARARLKSFGERLNLKFECARSAHLLPGEAPLVQVFHPARDRMRRYWGLRKHIWSPGDLLIGTSSRLLWITERYEGGYAPYGWVAHAGDRKAVASVETRSAGRTGGEVAIAFRSGRTWRVPVQQESESAFCGFIEALRQLLRT